jgi:periplasmic protein TonB
MASLTFEVDRRMIPKDPEPPLDFEGLVLSAPKNQVQSRWTLRVAASAILHGLAIAALVIIPLLSETEMPEAAQGTRVFFAAPTIAPPPPPPPPPPSGAPRAAVANVTRAVDTHRFVAPIDLPSSVPVADGLDLGVEGGVAGGVEGGVAGGVVGGVVGGLPDVAPVVKPVRVGAGIREPRKIKNVDPVYPFVARSARVQGVVVIECTVGIDGRVETAQVVQGVPLLEKAALDAVRQWRYTPTLYQGVPVPVIMTVTVTFALTGGF